MNKNQNEEEEKKPIKSKLEDLKNQLLSDDISDFTSLQVTQNNLDEFAIISPQEKIFITEYMKDYNGARAYIAAGYSEKGASQGASRLLTRVNIKSELNRRQELIQEASNITKEKVIKKLLELIDDCYTDEKTDRTSILKAMDMINKLTNLYAPENQINIQNNTDGEIKITIIKPNNNTYE